MTHHATQAKASTQPSSFVSELTPAELVARLALGDWQVFWLANLDRPIIGILPKVSFSLICQNGQMLIQKKDTQKQTLTPCDWHTYQHILQTYMASQPNKKNPPDGYHHGLLGYISYDVAAAALSSDIAVPDSVLAYFAHFDIYLSYQAPNYQLHCLRDGINTQALIAKLTTLAPIQPPASATLYPFWQKEEYLDAFAQTQHYLHAGDAYQINLTQGFYGRLPTPLASYLPSLTKAAQAPYSGYCAFHGQEILSVSPELFLQFKKQGGQLLAIAKPIKGTRPRHTDPTEDAKAKHALKHSEKDKAENVMIVDLLRNDLGKYAKLGGVSVPVKFAIESFSSVHHMVSTIHAVLDDNTSTLALLFDSLPPGSVTGGPKKRACELIATLEHKPRGAYCGTMGYLNFDGSGCFNVLIRTLKSLKTANGHETELWAGGGITVLSSDEEEYQECLDKARQIRFVLQNPS